MKITTFDPLVVTNDADSVVKVFEALGFEKTHAPVTSLEYGDVQDFRMKNPDGFHVDVAASASKLPRDVMVIRVNVDNFEEAYNILIGQGFKNTRGDDTVSTKSSKAATMVSPSGFMIALIEHIKD